VSGRFLLKNDIKILAAATVGSSYLDYSSLPSNLNYCSTLTAHLIENIRRGFRAQLGRESIDTEFSHIMNPISSPPVSSLVRLLRAGRSPLLATQFQTQRARLHATRRLNVIKQYPLADIGEGTSRCWSV